LFTNKWDRQWQQSLKQTGKITDKKSIQKLFDWSFSNLVRRPNSLPHPWCFLPSDPSGWDLSEGAKKVQTRLRCDRWPLSQCTVLFDQPKTPPPTGWSAKFCDQIMYNMWDVKEQKKLKLCRISDWITDPCDQRTNAPCALASYAHAQRTSTKQAWRKARCVGSRINSALKNTLRAFKFGLTGLEFRTSQEGASDLLMNTIQAFAVMAGVEIPRDLLRLVGLASGKIERELKKIFRDCFEGDRYFLKLALKPYYAACTQAYRTVVSAVEAGPARCRHPRSAGPKRRRSMREWALLIQADRRPQCNPDRDNQDKWSEGDSKVYCAKMEESDWVSSQTWTKIEQMQAVEKEKLRDTVWDLCKNCFGRGAKGQKECYCKWDEYQAVLSGGLCKKNTEVNDTRKGGAKKFVNRY